MFDTTSCYKSSDQIAKMFIAIQVPGHQAYYEKQAISRAPKALRIH